MVNPLIGTVILFAGDFAPTGWAFCHGQLLPINQYTALFSVIGTIYGGDGRNNFALPDLRGRVPIAPGPGLQNFNLGYPGGTPTVQLNVGNLPSHNHSQTASNNPPTKNTAAGASLASGDSNTPMDNIYVPGDGDVLMGLTTTVGGGQPHNNMQPYLATNYIIAFNGIFPTRS